MTIGIGLLGLGTVGAGVAAILASPQGRHPLVADLELKRVAGAGPGQAPARGDRRSGDPAAPTPRPWSMIRPWRLWWR
jgi:homoserine dehydrogenase